MMNAVELYLQESCVCIGNVQGPEEVNDTCVKTMDRGFTVCSSSFVYALIQRTCNICEEINTVKPG
jgi:hypothetical protein